MHLEHLDRWQTSHQFLGAAHDTHELRTKIMQDMKAKYGDDYARIIKLYFEQLADTSKK